MLELFNAFSAVSSAELTNLRFLSALVVVVDHGHPIEIHLLYLLFSLVEAACEEKQ